MPESAARLEEALLTELECIGLQLSFTYVLVPLLRITFHKISCPPDVVVKRREHHHFLCVGLDISL